MNAHYLIHYKIKEGDSFIAFLGLIEDVQITKVEDHFLSLEIERDEFDMSSIRELSLAELFVDFTSFLIPENAYIDPAILYHLLQKMNYGTYDISDMIRYAVRSKDEYAISYFKATYEEMFSHEIISSVLGFIEHDLNASKTAKALYMHRNTLNYRLDHFIQKSGIEIRAFRGAFAFYLLFY